MDEIEPSPLRGTEGVAEGSPFFSPDSLWIGFYSGGKLKKISIQGGAPMVLCDVGNFQGASWGPDDRIVFGLGAEGIWQVSADGGRPEVLVSLDPDQGELAAGLQILPGGNALLFTLTEGTNWDSGRIVVQSLDSGERRVLIEGGSDARYVPTGHLVYALGGKVIVVPFDARRLEITGGAVPVLEGVARAMLVFTGAAHFSFSETGSLVYAEASRARRGVGFVDRRGEVTFLSERRGDFSWPRVSPDGERVAFVIAEEGRRDIWIYELERGVHSRFTTAGNNDTPTWSPDGRWLAFSSDREGDSAT